MSFDYSKLKGKIKEKYNTQERFSAALGISRSSFSMRINNVLDFSQKEMESAANLLGFPKEEIPAYFFTPLVQKNEQN